MSTSNKRHNLWTRLMERHENNRPPKPLMWFALSVLYLVGGIGFLFDSALRVHLVLAVIFLVSSLGAAWRWRRHSVRRVEHKDVN